MKRGVSITRLAHFKAHLNTADPPFNSLDHLISINQPINGMHREGIRRVLKTLAQTTGEKGGDWLHHHLSLTACLNGNVKK